MPLNTVSILFAQCLQIKHDDLPVLGGGSGDAHGAVAAVNALHLDKSALLVVLVGKTNKPIATTLAGHGIGHDLSRLAGWEARLEERNQNVFVDLRAEVTDEDAVLGAAVITVAKLASSEQFKRSTKLTVGQQDRRQMPS